VHHGTFEGRESGALETAATYPISVAVRRLAGKKVDAAMIIRAGRLPQNILQITNLSSKGVILQNG
jgi:hypothetical protein